MNMISFLNTSDRTAWTQTDPEKPFGFSGPVPCLCNTNIPAIDYFLISPPQMAWGAHFSEEMRQFLRNSGMLISQSSSKILER